MSREGIAAPRFLRRTQAPRHARPREGPLPPTRRQQVAARVGPVKTFHAHRRGGARALGSQTTEPAG